MRLTIVNALTHHARAYGNLNRKIAILGWETRVNPQRCPTGFRVTRAVGEPPALHAWQVLYCPQWKVDVLVWKLK
eukprot:285415-Pyramimonas_sp.AAC.1